MAVPCPKSPNSPTPSTASLSSADAHCHRSLPMHLNAGQLTPPLLHMGDLVAFPFLPLLAVWSITQRADQGKIVFLSRHLFCSNLHLLFHNGRNLCSSWYPLGCVLGVLIPLSKYVIQRDTGQHVMISESSISRRAVPYSSVRPVRMAFKTTTANADHWPPCLPSEKARRVSLPRLSAYSRVSVSSAAVRWGCSARTTFMSAKLTVRGSIPEGS